MSALSAASAIDTPKTGPASWLEKNEGFIVLGLAALLLIVNLATWVLYPTSWVDEAMFADPAISYLQGKGFTSTIWWETSHKIWSGNVPLYSATLVPWLKMVGISLLKVHALNYTVISLTMVIFWLAVKRLGWIPAAGGRIGLLLLFFISYPMSFACRCARPDCLGMLLCAFCLLAWSWQNKTARNIVLFAAGFLVPWSGLQLVAYVGLVSFLAFVMEGRKSIFPLAILMLGIFVGGAALFSFYKINHLTGVIDTIKETKRVRAEAAFGHDQSALGRAKETTRRIIMDQLKDYGIMPALLALAVLGFSPQVRSDRRLNMLAWTGFLASFAIVAALEIFLHFLDYYHWMSHVILAIVVIIILTVKWSTLGRTRMTIVCLILLGSLVGGLPLRLGLGMAMDQAHEWHEMNQLIDVNIKPTDVVYSDYMAFFPLKARANAVYSPAYYGSHMMSAEEFESVNVLVLDPINYDGYSKPFFEGKHHWSKVAGFSQQLGPIGQMVQRMFPRYAKQPTSCGYAITILRRDADTNAVAFASEN